MEIFDYEILVQELVPPVGRNKYFAVLQFVYANTENGTQDIKPDLGESHGETEAEARRKMENKYQEWFASRN
ncbi:MAG: hypothetical protein U0998_03880 [Moraxellaceae bacterium]|nr:hypothetical protein [Moraxellaceae bacterium]MDZ4386345.1 hypothetical protein [Moraxellaceae bacterium]